MCTLNASSPICDISMYFAVLYGCAVLSVGMSSQNVVCEVCLISYVLDMYWSSSRHLLCVYDSPCATAVLPCTRICCTMCTGMLCYPERVVLCVPVYCTTHCIVPGIRGCVCHLLRGTCSVCTLAGCYGCVALVYERVILCVPVYCATHCTVLGIRGRVCKLVLL